MRFAVAVVTCLVIAGTACSEKKPRAGTGGETSGKVDATKLDALANTDVPGFARRPQSSMVRSVRTVQWESQQPNAAGVKVQVIATIQACIMCQPMDLAAWQANPNLKKMLSSTAAQDPELVWEVGGLDVAGKKAITTHTLHHSKTTGAAGTTTGYANNLWVYFNDGTADILLIVDRAGFTSAASEAELAKEMPKSDLIAAAQAVLAQLIAKL